jgi:hypothetical protein
MSREDGGSAADKARELDRIEKKLKVDGPVGDGLSDYDLRALQESEQREDRERIDRDQRDAADRRRYEAREPERRPATPTEPILTPEGPIDSILGQVDTTRGALDLSPDPKSELTWGMVDALRRPGNVARLFAAGLGLVAMLVILYFGLQVGQAHAPAPGAATGTPAPAIASAPLVTPTGAGQSARPVVQPTTAPATSAPAAIVCGLPGGPTCPPRP